MSALLDLGLIARPKIQLVRQAEATECGLASLAMIAQFHGRRIDLSILRRQFTISLRGTSLRSLMAMADEMGFSTRAVKLGLEEIGSLNVPAVLHWDMNHFVVLERVKGNVALVHDPAGGSRWWTLEALSDHFTGVALEARPADSFEAGEQRERLRITQLWTRATGLKSAIAQAIVLSLVMHLFVLALPYFSQLAIDKALPALDSGLLAVLAIGFGLFAIVNSVAELLRAFVLLSAGTSLGFGISINIARRLFRLPVTWFEKRHVGDIISRFQSIMPVREALTQGAVAALLDGSLSILTLVMMFIYSPTLSVVALAALGTYGLARLASFPALRKAQEASIIAGAAENTLMIETLRGIATLRLFNKESSRHALWQTALADHVNGQIAVLRVAAWQKSAGTLIFGLEAICSIWIAISFAMNGGFSVGMVFAYIAFKTQFLARSTSLFDQGIAFRMLALHLERLADIAKAPEDISFTSSPGLQAELRGSLEIRGVSFRYSDSDPLVLDGIDLEVTPGEHVAITGPSGGGKSTLVRILLGLVEPDEGMLLVDGVPLRSFGHRNYHRQVAAVLQDDSLFAGSIAFNIALFDESLDMERVVEAARAASIHDDIAEMPMGYETLVGDMGSALSGGQKQRVLLARALYRQPRLLVMDEGTSHLDPETEKAVSAAISGMGITRIIIAHRAETLAGAEKVFVLEDRHLRLR